MADANRADVLEMAWQIEEVLQAASAGDYTKRCPVSITESFADNPLATIVPSINLLLDDLRAKERKRKRAQESLQNTIVELQQQVETVQKQAVAIRELSTPAIEVWDGVLVMPIIGVVDTARGQSIVEEMLSAIAAKQIRYVILDITGVDIVDTSVANHLIQAVMAGRLLGAVCILTGVNPFIARSLVSLGVDLGGIQTLGNLKEGLKHCLSRLGRTD